MGKGPREAGTRIRAFVVTGRTVERVRSHLEQLKKQAIEYVTFNVPGEPTTTVAKAGVELARRAKSDLVVSIGGGSVLDTGKVIAAMLTNSGELEDYLEGVGAGKPLSQSCVPHIAIPTTAGTGAEVTCNAVLGVPEHQVKVSMRSPLMLPRLAVVDPVLTYSMPPSVTASTGLDALTQLMEAYVSNKANPLTDGICREGLKRAGRSLRRAYDGSRPSWLGQAETGKAGSQNGSNCGAREDMALASLFGGLALANAKLGAVHGFAGALGGMTSAPHGVICGRLLPYVMEANVQALQRRDSSGRSASPEHGAGSPALARYDEVAQILSGKAAARAAEGVAWVQSLCAEFEIPSLVEFGLKEKDFPTVVAKAQRSSSMKGNPIKLTDNELVGILKKSR